MTLTLQNSPKSDFCMCITKSSHLIDQHCQDYFFSVRLTFVIKNDLVAFLHSQAKNKPVSINYYTLQHFNNNALQITPQIYLPACWLKARSDQFTQRNAIKRNRCIMTLLL